MMIKKIIKNSFFVIFIPFLCGCECKENGYEYVDLDLPSGNLWATCNIGAKLDYERGDCFAWGETEPKECTDCEVCDPPIEFDRSSYKFITKDFMQSKYNLNESSEYYDGRYILEPCDDAASVHMGGRWVMPTSNDISELWLECDYIRVSDYKGTGVSGMLYISKRNGKSVFIPADCWSASLCEDLFYPWGGSGDGIEILKKKFDFALTFHAIPAKRCVCLPVRGLIPGKHREMPELDTLVINKINRGDTSRCDSHYCLE